jgi:hypothetical protein
VADQIAYDLWQKIQNNPYYRNKTDLIVTTDHGRNSGPGDRFKDHGSWNHGNRHLPFLAIGPDFKRNTVVDTRRDEIDIAPTIGAILGFQTPYSDGEPMKELFRNPHLTDRIVSGGERRISLSACATGLHMVWSQKSGQEWDIYYKRAFDGSNASSSPVKLFENGLDNNYFYEAEVISRDDGLVFVVALGYSLKHVEQADDTFTWKVFGRKSVDGGNTWQEMQQIKNVGLFAANPSLTSKEDDILIGYASIDNNFRTWGTSLRVLYNNVKQEKFKSSIINTLGEVGSRSASLATDQKSFYALWSSEELNSVQRNWNMFFDHTTKTHPPEWRGNKAVTSNERNPLRFHMDNSIAANTSGLIHALITVRQDKVFHGKQLAGPWQTLLLSRSGLDNPFIRGEKFYNFNKYEAWNPHISFLGPETTEFITIWEQHLNRNGAEIYARKRNVCGWGNILKISTVDGKDSAEPALATYNGDSYIGWQDKESGNWKIKVRRIK